MSRSGVIGPTLPNAIVTRGFSDVKLARYCGLLSRGKLLQRLDSAAFHDET